MLEAFQKGEDIHARTARLVFGARTDEELKEARRFAKIVNFAIAYAIEPWGLSQRVGISSAGSEESYRGLLQHLQRRATLHGRSADSRARARLCALNLRPHSTAGGNRDRNANIRKAAEREAINMPIQGTASDIVKIAMLRVDQEFKRAGLEARLLMQVHDELLVEVPENEVEKVIQILKHEMESAVSLDVPLVADVGVGRQLDGCETKTGLLVSPQRAVGSPVESSQSKQRSPR
jgi:DNA polymerase-1